MEIATILRPKAVRVLSSVKSKRRLLDEIAGIAGKAYGLDVGKVKEALCEREVLGPTGVGGGVALPHARVEGLDRVVGVLTLLERPVSYDAVDRQPVDLAFALFAPVSSGVEHLKALALVSRTLRGRNVCAKLRANPDPVTLYTIVADPQSVRAA